MAHGDEKLRIAMLGHKRIPSREGGVEIVVAELATRMVKKGHRVVCYNRKGHHVSGSEFDSKKCDNYNGVELKTVLTVDKRGLAAMTASVSAAVRAAFGSYDVVHFHAEGSCAMIWLPKLFGKKCIATVHGLDHKRAKWGKFALKYILFGEKCAVKFADEIIVLSKNVQNYFKTVYDRDTVFVPNGISKPNTVPADEIFNEYGLTKDSYILYLGRLVPEKGIHYLIEAFKTLDTDKKLVIAGGASDTKQYEEEIRALGGEDERIIFTGFVQGAKIAELYSNCYFYVLPSDLEGMPMSLLEAMSYGNCCLVSDIPECAEVVTDVGVLFEHSNVKDLADKMRYLCDSPDKVRACATRSADYVCKRFDWEDVTAQTLALYGVKGEVDEDPAGK